MAIIPANTDYTDRDFESILARLKQLISSVFPRWTDFQTANFGNIIIELFSFVGDGFHFYLNNQGKESKITLATQRKNLIALAKMLNYIPGNNRAATVDITVTLSAPPIDDFNLPVGQIVRTKQVTDPVEFQMLTALSIPAATNPPTVTIAVENSETLSEAFASTGIANQDFELAETPFIDDSASPTAANGAYTQVDNFLSSTASDRHFVVVVDQNDRATIRFGNGVNGEIPVGSITVIYRTGGGAVGNVEAGAIAVIEGSFVDDSSNSVQVTVTNPLAATGGINRQTVEQIRQLAPESARAINRSVAREDYEINAERLPEVARALMLSSDQDSSLPENTGLLFIIPVGDPPGVASSALLAAALNQVIIEFPKTITFQVEARVAIYLTIDVAARVYKQSGFAAATVRANIESALGDFFALFDDEGKVNEKIDFGYNLKDADGNPSGEISWSDLFNEVRDAAGVRKVGAGESDFLLSGVRDDVSIEVREFPVLGDIVLVDGDTGLPF